ncbi:MAG: hypothetical protein ACYCO5_15060 [Acidobacteriaceae bacterium]
MNDEIGVYGHQSVFSRFSSQEGDPPDAESWKLSGFDPMRENPIECLKERFLAA